MSSELIAFPGRSTSNPSSSGPSMYLRYEAGGAVRRIELSSYADADAAEAALPKSTLTQARRIAREAAIAAANNPRLQPFDPTQQPRSLEPRHYGAGLFLVQSFPRKLSRRVPLYAPLRAQKPSLLVTIAQIFSCAVRTLFSS